jgi:hypothetical protein
MALLAVQIQVYQIAELKSREFHCIVRAAMAGNICAENRENV